MLQLVPEQRNQSSRDLVLGGYGTGLHFAGSAVIGEVNDGRSVVDLDTKVCLLVLDYVCVGLADTCAGLGNAEFVRGGCFVPC